MDTIIKPTFRSRLRDANHRVTNKYNQATKPPAQEGQVEAYNRLDDALLTLLSVEPPLDDKALAAQVRLLIKTLREELNILEQKLPELRQESTLRPEPEASLKCDDCGKTGPDVSETCCPYAQEINERDEEI